MVCSLVMLDCVLIIRNHHQGYLFTSNFPALANNPLMRSGSRMMAFLTSIRIDTIYRPALHSRPLALALAYRPEDVYVVKVLGDSMTCAEVQHTIPEGSMVALHTKLEPRKRDIVAAWVVSLGIDVLKIFGRGLNDEVVLESYNPAGARFPTSKYELVLQGVYIGHWMEGRRG
jgi:hypothetical protein